MTPPKIRKKGKGLKTDKELFTIKKIFFFKIRLSKK